MRPRKGGRLERFFRGVTSRPRTAVALAFLVIAACGAGLPRLVKDTSVRAFIPAGHPALRTDAEVRDVFGISDTIAVALLCDGDETVFTASMLSRIDELSSAIAGLPNVRYDRVSSLATESSITGDAGSVLIEPYIAPFAMDEAFARDSRTRWRFMRPHRGTLVSEDGGGALVLAEIVDPALAHETYAAVLELTADFADSGVEAHVAGAGAVSSLSTTAGSRDTPYPFARHRFIPPSIAATVVIPSAER